jgi:hypothetical protein
METRSTGIAVMLTCLLGLAVQIALSAETSAQSKSGMAMPRTPQLMDREKEIALALSACPPSVAEKAAVYVLGQSGYVKVRDGKNGFTAIVQHALPISQDPQCLDAEGTRTFLLRYLEVAELRAQGRSPDEIKRFVERSKYGGPENRSRYPLHPEAIVPLRRCLTAVMRRKALVSLRSDSARKVYCFQQPGESAIAAQRLKKRLDG